MLNEEGLAKKLTSLLGLPDLRPDLQPWIDLIKRIRNPKGTARIAVVAKYVEFREGYKSLSEAINHAGYGLETQIDIKWVESEKLEAQAPETLLGDCHGIIVPGGSGVRGMKGLINAAQFAREGKIPFFGIGLGMQMAIVEFARNAAMLEGADSTEYNENPVHRVICKLGELVDTEELGGATRLGSYPCNIQKGSLAGQAYMSETVDERHRNRFEFNQTGYREKLEGAGMAFSGLSQDNVFVEIVEIPGHPFFLGTQFHPEFKSKPLAPHPLFTAFVKACAARG
jgi:CTP synthase